MKKNNILGIVLLLASLVANFMFMLVLLEVKDIVREEQSKVTNLELRANASKESLIICNERKRNAHDLLLNLHAYQADVCMQTGIDRDVCMTAMGWGEFTLPDRPNPQSKPVHP